MPQVRTIGCDIPNCNETYTETEWGLGYPGWSIVQGICTKQDTKPEQPSDMTSFLCPKHTHMLARAIEEFD